MDKKRKNENDEISQLLDSFQADQEDTLEQKMDRFTKTQNRSRVKKHKPEPEIPFQSKKEEPSLGDTFVVGSKDLNEPKEDLSATRTVMWNADELKQEADATNKTVVIDDDEIQSLLEEGKGPQLKREVINKKKDSKKKTFKKNNSKTGLYIGLGVVGVLLISLLIFGGIKLVTSGLSGSDEKTEEVQKLRKKISDLKNQLSEAKADLESAQKAQESAQSDVDSLTSKINSANSSLRDAQNAVNSAQSDYNNLVDILRRRAELDNIPNDQITQDELSELSDIRTNHPNLENEVNSAKDDLDAANAALSTAQKNSNVSSLENKLSTAQTKLNSASSDVKDAQSKVDSLNSQINDYQSQLDDLD